MKPNPAIEPTANGASLLTVALWRGHPLEGEKPCRAPKSEYRNDFQAEWPGIQIARTDNRDNVNAKQTFSADSLGDIKGRITRN